MVKSSYLVKFFGAGMSMGLDKLSLVMEYCPNGSHHHDYMNTSNPFNWNLVHGLRVPVVLLWLWTMLHQTAAESLCS